MPNLYKANLLDTLTKQFGELRKIKGSESLFMLGNDAARIYIRYSKVHPARRTFFGLRQVDLRQLEGHNSFLCFLTDEARSPLFIPYEDFEEVFRSARPAKDGQYKVQLFSHQHVLELYIARLGRFNVEAYIGFDVLSHALDTASFREVCDLSHAQVQTLLAGIGHIKGYDVFIPGKDRGALDWSLTKPFHLSKRIPAGFDQVGGILSEIDVLWIARGRNAIEGLFEVEHSTPIYSGLLRFNDIFLTDPRVLRFTIVSNDSRRALFSRQLFRPTFIKSGLAELTSFLEYANVLGWHTRIAKGVVHG